MSYFKVMPVPANPNRMVAPTSMQIGAGGMDPNQAAGQLAHSPQIYSKLIFLLLDHML